MDKRLCFFLNTISNQEIMTTLECAKMLKFYCYESL